jgi:hypothetical protein
MKANPKVFNRPRWLVVTGAGQMEQYAAAGCASTTSCRRKNLWAVCRTIRAAAAARPAKLTIAGLVEDALWEQRRWLPPCLLAEALWNPNEKPESIIAKVSATRDAHCLV